MIRRDLCVEPRNADWLLFSQVEHAKLSHALAAAWKDLLPGAPSGVLAELLAAVLHHDDGWADWERDPEFDPEHARPYDFMEMPPESAKAIWTRSIDGCRAIGPLAGWAVAGHFVALQSPVDDDHAEWAPWLAEQNRRRGEWLSGWFALDPQHTQQLAERCLLLLQAFDWLSLWLCRETDYGSGNELTLGEAERGFGPYRFKVSEIHPTKAEGILVSVDPWPFATDNLWLEAETLRAPADRYSHFGQLRREAKRSTLLWSLHREYERE